MKIGRLLSLLVVCLLSPELRADCSTTCFLPISGGGFCDGLKSVSDQTWVSCEDGLAQAIRNRCEMMPSSNENCCTYRSQFCSWVTPHRREFCAYNVLTETNPC